MVQCLELFVVTSGVPQGCSRPDSKRGRVSEMLLTLRVGRITHGGGPVATHRKTSQHPRRIWAVVLTAFTIALSGALVGQPVAAVSAQPQGKIVMPRNANVIASCKFQVNRVANNSVYFTMTANARPADLDGYRANAFT